MQQSLCGNTTTSIPRSSQRPKALGAGSRRHDQIGPSRTRLVTRHNPYATTPSQGDLEGSATRLQRRKIREGPPRASTKLPSASTTDTTVASQNNTWEGASQDATHIRLPKPSPATLLPKHERTPARVSTITLPPPSATPCLVAQDAPLDEFGLYSSFECEDNYGSNFFDSFDISYATSWPEQATVAHGVEETPRATPCAVAPLPEPPRPSAGKINLSNLHHRLMRSKGFVPDIPLDRLDGVVRQNLLRHVDLLMFKRQAQSREQRKWRGYREPEEEDLLKRPNRKVRFNPCSREGRNRKQRPVSSGVDELVYRVNCFKISA